MQNKNTLSACISNELVNIVTPEFTPSDLNVFDYCCFLAKNKGTSEIKIDYGDLKNIVFKNRNITNKELFDNINDLSKKLLQCWICNENSEHTSFDTFVLFQRFKSDINEQILYVQVSEAWSHLLNNMTCNFTMFEIEEYISFKRKSSKILYKQLAKYRGGYKKSETGTCWWKPSVEEFRILFDISEKERTRNIKTRYIDPAIKEIEHLFKKLEVKVVKKGNSIVGYEFNYILNDNVGPLEKTNPIAIPPEVKAVKEIQKNKAQAPKTRFHNFEQREYSDEFYDDLVRRKLM